MEQFNYVILRGRIGQVKVSEVGLTKVARFSLATNLIYRDMNGNAVIETTWTPVVAWGSDRIDVDGLAKGSDVAVEGRLSSQRFTGADGVERTVLEVKAKSVSVIDEHLQAEVL